MLIVAEELVNVEWFFTIWFLSKKNKNTILQQVKKRNKFGGSNPPYNPRINYWLDLQYELFD